MSEFVTLNEIRSAKERISGVAVRTLLYRLERARLQMAGFPEPQYDLYIKAESEQPIGSFKLRGAYNMVSQLSPEARSRGVITYSSGNHAQGVAYAARAVGEGHHRHAVKRTRGKKGGNQGARCRDRRGGSRFIRAADEGRRVSSKIRLRDDSAL